MHPPLTVLVAGLGLGLGGLLAKPVPLTYQLVFLPQKRLKSHPFPLLFDGVQTPTFPGNVFDA